MKKGIGSELFRYAVSELKKNYKRVTVSCLKENKSNAFYKKMGCKAIGESDFLLNNVSYEEFLYEI